MTQIKLFSHLELCLPDASNPRLRLRKTGLLLAYLACFPGRPHLRSYLASLFWPDAEAAAGRASLRTSLSELRDRLISLGLPAETLITTAHDVSLNPACLASDVGEFRNAIRRAASGARAERKSHLALAVGLYRGPLLAEIAVDWVEQERDVLAGMCREALGQLVAWNREDKDLPAALAFAHLAVRLDPDTEDASLQLMEILFDTGAYDQVFREYARLARRLIKQELLPSPEARTLRRRALAAARKQATEAARHSASLKPSNLYRALTPFFGRQAEIPELQRLLEPAGPRLITLTGPGGIGKTRLAREAALQASARFEGRVYWANMEEIDDVSQITAHAAQAILTESVSTADPLARLQRSLDSKPLLLVLDNFEHLVEGGRLHIPPMLTTLPMLKLLVTSRQRLQLQGEQVFPIAPLPTPGAVRTIEAMLGFDSVRLFVDRARLVQPDFDLTDDNVDAVATLCDSLDGIPLALEIAAAWCDTLSPTVMVRETRRRFDLLISPFQDVNPRHASLWKVVEWSYARLEPVLQKIFACLAVFRGGWTLEAMTAICPPGATVGAVRQLQERSLVTMRDTNGEPRYFLLETLREFADLHLSENDRHAALRRHAAYFLQLGLSAYPQLRTAEAAHWLERMARDHENLLLALETWRTVERYDHYLRLASALRSYWLSRSHAQTAQTLLRQGLASYAPQDKIRADALRVCAVCSDMRDPAQARMWLEESLQITECLNDRAGSADTLLCLARLSDPHDLSMIEKALHLYADLGHSEGEANCLHLKAGVLFITQDYAQAEPILLECVRLRERIGDRTGQIFTFHYLGNIYLHRGDYARAHHAYSRSLTFARDLRNGFAEGQTLVLMGLADYCYGKLRSARRQMEQGLALLEEAYAPLYETTALAHLARIALDQSDMHSALAHIRTAGQRLLTLPAQAAYYPRIGALVLRVAARIAAVQHNYRDACKFSVLADTADTRHRLPLTRLDLDDIEIAATLLQAALAPETISALRSEYAALPLPVGLDTVCAL